MKKDVRETLIAQCLAIVALFFALLTSNAPSYYVLLHFIVCGICAYLAVTAFQRGKLNWVWILGGLAVLYNPLFPVRLDREVWFDVYVATIMLMGWMIWKYLRTNRLQETNASSNVEPTDIELREPSDIGFLKCPVCGLISHKRAARCDCGYDFINNTTVTSIGGKRSGTFSFNGIGTLYYGNRDKESDGSYITTKWFVFLFLPLFPLGSYRVLPAGETGTYLVVFSSTQTSYLVHRVPLNLSQVRNVYCAAYGWVVVAFLIPVLFQFMTFLQTL